MSTEEAIKSDAIKNAKNIKLDNEAKKTFKEGVMLDSSLNGIQVENCSGNDEYNKIQAQLLENYNTTQPNRATFNTIGSNATSSNTTQPNRAIFNTTGSDAIKLSKNPKPYLTLRICLSLHARPHDPLGLILPTRMICSCGERDS